MANSNGKQKYVHALWEVILFSLKQKEAKVKVIYAEFRIIFQKQVSQDRKKWKTNV